MTNCPISSIVIGQRARKDLGDISSLAESIKTHDMLHPVVLTKDLLLVAGFRRIKAAEMLGMEEVPVRIVDVADLLGAERDENEVRKDFTPTEAIAIGRLIEEQERPKIAAEGIEKIRRAAVDREARKRGEQPPFKYVPSAAATEAAVAAAVGMSQTTYYRAKKVIATAEAEPEKFGDLPEQMDRTGNVLGAHREMKRRREGNGRHPIHRKAHFSKPNEEMERSLHALAGLCSVVARIDIAELDPTLVSEWAKALGQHLLTLRRARKEMLNV